MNRYTIERERVIRQVYSIEVIARSEEEARIKANEFRGELVESSVLSDDRNIIDTETLDTEE